MFRSGLLAIAIVATLFTLSPVLAHDGAVGIIKERMKLMTFMGQNTKQIAPYAMGALEMNLKAVESAAINISIAAQNAIAKFPEHSTSKESEAKPNIWENWDEFKTSLEKLSADAATLTQLAKDGKSAEISAQFGKIASSCKTCHTKFRLKKE